VYEAFTYVMACRSLGLNPSLNHLLFLEDQVYISLQGHLHNAHSTKQLRGMQTKLLSSGETSFTKKGWGGKPDAQMKTKQFRYECVIQRVIDGQPAEFRAEGVADASNVTGFATDLKLEQMAEARAMRRCLSRAFPVGLASFEDIQEQESLATSSYARQNNEPDASENPLATKIAQATSTQELEALKPEIAKSKSNDMVKAYASRQNEIKNAPKAMEVGTDLLRDQAAKFNAEPETPESSADHDAKLMEDAEREEKEKIAELAEEINGET